MNRKDLVDCDVFMKENSILDLGNNVIDITGNLYAGKNCCVKSGIFVGGDVILEDGADVLYICAEGNVEIGNFSDTQNIYSGKSVSIGNYTFTNNIYAKDDVFIGYQTYSEIVSYGGDIFVEEHVSSLKELFIQLFFRLKCWLHHF